MHKPTIDDKSFYKFFFLGIIVALTAPLVRNSIVFILEKMFK